ncbi:MAG TPA: adenylate/guanylate cyclase domain-containing protein [Candidatus Binatia bacterium]|nr:adenylate/guanylate cyclase domain-containing protein [Candidatus Binatia bacterium]
MNAGLPSGVVTFLFSDIEGSTKLWERAPDAMREALAAHDALLRRVVEQHHGAVFKTVGDACYCAFGNPADAVTAAVEGQRALHSASWPDTIGEIRVRMGVHSGQCTQSSGDYFGPPSTAWRGSRPSRTANRFSSRPLPRRWCATCSTTARSRCATSARAGSRI